MQCDGESHADDLAKRLAFEKAKCIAGQHPDAIVIGSDQVAWREGAPDIFIGKPLSPEKAIKQLQANSALSRRWWSITRLNSASSACRKLSAILKLSSRCTAPAALSVKASASACLKK